MTESFDVKDKEETKPDECKQHENPNTDESKNLLDDVENFMDINFIDVNIEPESENFLNCNFKNEVKSETDIEAVKEEDLMGARLGNEVKKGNYNEVEDSMNSNLCNGTVQGTVSDKNRLLLENSNLAKKKVMNQKLNNDEKIHLTLCGCGFLGLYQLGVATCLAVHGGKIEHRLDKVAGSSSGSLVATCFVVMKEKIPDCIDFCLDTANQIRRRPLGIYTPGFCLADRMEKYLEETLPEDAHLKASGKLHISVTNLRTQFNELYTHFKSRDELIRCLVCSCFMPFWTGVKFPRFRGSIYVDGFFSNNLPKFDDGVTLSIAPWYGPIDINPTDKRYYFHVNFSKVPMGFNFYNFKHAYEALSAPKIKKLKKYFYSGFRDAETFLKRENSFQENSDNAMIVRIEEIFDKYS